MILNQKINLSAGQADFFLVVPHEIWLSLTTGQPISRALVKNSCPMILFYLFFIYFFLFVLLLSTTDRLFD